MERHPQVRLISFGAGLTGIEGALTRIRKQAEAFPLINDVRTYSEKDLTEDYHELFPDFPVRYPKGYGLWSWKPWLVERELRTMVDGDILIYVDAGVEINQKGEARFSQYLDRVARKGFLFFSMSLQNRLWTKPDATLLRHEFFYRNQICATVFFVRADQVGRRFAKQWLDLCGENDGSHLLDPVTSDKDSDLSIAHRHDQSALSVVVYSNGISTIEGDESYHEPWRHGRKYPLLAFRNKTGTSLLRTNLSSLPFRSVRLTMRLLTNFSTLQSLIAGQLRDRDKRI